MTSKVGTVEGGGGRKEGRFLSAHRCPEVDRLSQSLTETKPCHTAATDSNMQREAEDTQGDHPDITVKEWDAQGNSSRKAESSAEADYMEVYSGRRSSSRPSAEDQEEEMADEGSDISDWSEEDLSLHFSPSVINSSDEESSDVDRGFECVDVAMEKEANGQERSGQRMVPKRQIQLRRRDSEENLNPASEEKPVVQVKDKEEVCEREGAQVEESAGELRSPRPHHRPEGLLRQHSMPASFHQRSVGNPEDGHNNRVYKGIIAGATQGLPGVVRSKSNPRQRLQKSFSLDETKTKMASCIIKSVLSKKMQVEQSTIVAPSDSHNSCNKHNTNAGDPCSSNVKNPTESSSNNTKNYLQLASQPSSTDVTPQPLQGQTKPVVRQSSGPLPPSQGGRPPEANTHTQSGDMEREGEAGAEELRFPSCPGGKAPSSSVFKAKAPVHVVRDMRSLVKNTYNLSFRNNNNKAASSAITADKGIGQNHSPSVMYKVIGQEDSPPPSYQQAVGVKGHDDTANRKGSQTGAQPSPSVPASRGYVARVTAALGQSLDRRECERFTHPISEQRKASQPALTQTEQESSNQIWPKKLSNMLSKTSTTDQSTEPSRSDSGAKQKPPQAETPKSRHTVPDFNSSTQDSQRPVPPSSSPCQPQQTILAPTPQGQSHILGYPGQPMLPSYFYTPNPLAGYTAALQAHLGSYIQGPVSYIQAPAPSPAQLPQTLVQAQLPQTLVQAQPSSTIQTTLKRTQSEEKQERTTPSVSSYHPDGYKGLIKYSPPHKNSTIASQENKTSKVPPETQEQQQPQQQQQQIMCNVQGFLNPTNAGGEFQQGRTQFVYPGMAPSPAAPGGLYSGHATRHVLLDPESGQCFYMDMPPQPQRKMLFDPETGRYVEVYLPSSNPAPTTTVLPVGCRAVPYHPSLAMSALYAPQYLPFTLQTPTLNLTHTAP